MTAFGERPVGAWFEIDVGWDDWVRGQKVASDTFVTDSGRTLKVSYWTKTRNGGAS